MQVCEPYCLTELNSLGESISSYHYHGLSGDKQYKFEEILPIYKAASNEAEAGTFADFMEAFKTFDREGQGLIHAAELRHVLTSLGESVVFVLYFAQFILLRKRSLH